MSEVTPPADITNTVRALLLAHGWLETSGVLTSPDGQIWFDERRCRQDPVDLYARFARHRRMQLERACPANPAYQQLLEALEKAFEEVALMVESVEATNRVFEHSLGPHGFTTRLWSFGYPSVRATARHPLGGVAYIEWIHGEELGAGWWVDDYEQWLRRSWRHKVPTTAATLESHLQDAVEALLGVVLSDLGPGSALATLSDAEQLRELEYWQKFSVVR